jgi:hypothetical protein
VNGYPAWGGRRVRRLLALVLFHKGDVCHLCGLPGADSPDHDPPRSVLMRRGVPDPDALDYLWPSHLGCNLTRNDGPITPALRARCRAKRLAALGLDDRPDLSPRLAARRPRLFEPTAHPGKASLPVSLPGPSQKTEQR